MKKKKIYALGFFDGVHLGHQALLNACVAAAQQLGAVPQYLADTTVEAKGIVDYSNTHPMLRKDAEGAYTYKTPEEAEAQLRKEVLAAELFSK